MSWNSSVFAYLGPAGVDGCSNFPWPDLQSLPAKYSVYAYRVQDFSHELAIIVVNEGANVSVYR